MPQFFLDSLEIDEPIGWDDLTLRIIRDENRHGIMFEAATTDLGFYGVAANYLIDRKNESRFESNVVFSYIGDCGGQLTGRIDFGRFRQDCGSSCIVFVAVEQESCAMILQNRFDQRVDIDNQIAFDKLTNLQSYPGLNFPLNLPARAIKSAVEGYTIEPDQVSIDFTQAIPLLKKTVVRPTYSRELYNNINQGQLIPTNNYFIADDIIDLPITPQLLFDDVVDCFDGDFQVNARMAGTLVFTKSPNLADIKIILCTWDGVGSFFDDRVVIDSVTIADNINDIGTFNFDATLAQTIPLSAGIGLYYVVQVTSVDTEIGYNIDFSDATYFNITANRLCPDSNANVGLIHETLSRITEAITDNCLRVKSEYYGRTDSMPYSFPSDGCGSLRVLTSGLKIRKADGAKHFISLQEAFNGLRAIDNIGMGIVGSDLRIEPVEWFYQDDEIIVLDAIPNARFFVDSKYAYSIVQIGYAKWQVERINGLDEPNSKKEFRTGISSVSNTLNAVSNFVAGSYPIEITRQQSYAETGAADTTFDNDTFIICVKRDGYGYSVEQGGQDITGVFSPNTIYNWRIRPRFNLQRWWKSISQVYNNLSNTTSKLFFASGEGNLTASGSLAIYDGCGDGSGAENEDLKYTDLPVSQPERMEFSYPISLKEYNLVKDNPYGYVCAQCGNGEFVKGHIVSINYKPATGIAEFNLLLKWPSN